MSAMKHLLRLTDLTPDAIRHIFLLADQLREGRHTGALQGKCVVLFFPSSSIRTRVTFEKGLHLLGAQPILFPSDALDKKEDIRDVCGYLNNWADALIIRHRDIHLLEAMAACSEVPIINAMTDVNHPCEVLADLYALSRRRDDWLHARYLFAGRRGNIGLAWKEAADVLGFSLEQCCPPGYEIDGLTVHRDIRSAIVGKDVICTDPVPAADLPTFRDCQVTLDCLRNANPGALLNPCPPFFRGEEVAADAIDSDYFVGYDFKRTLLEVQQAVLLYCLQA